MEKELGSISGVAPFAVEELRINHLLPEGKRNRVRHAFNYRVDWDDLGRFDREIASFLRKMREA